MTTHVEELLGVQVTGSDGKVIGTIEQVFEDDVTGAPAWASVRSGKASRFVPLGVSHVTEDGLAVPLDSQIIAGAPKFEVGEYMSPTQTGELEQYYGLTVPPQAGPRSKGGEKAEGRAGDKQERSGDLREKTGEQGDDEWLVRREQRLKVTKESQESGHVRLHRYVDTEPAEQTVKLVHEEYDVEVVPADTDQPIGDALVEGEQEVILHAERGIPSKETVPVERMRLVTRSVEGDETFRDEVQRERIEVEPDETTASAGSKNKSRP